MRITDHIIELARYIADRMEIPQVVAIHLPQQVENPVKPDEFGFIFLEDESAGPFYTSLDQALAELWQQYPQGYIEPQPALPLIEELNSASPARRALALGAYNAMSQHVMRRAGYLPLPSGGSKDMGLPTIEPGQTIGMVGFFRPLIAPLLQQGIPVLVLEKNPARVELQPGIILSTDPADLAGCSHVLCTASTLLNGTLDSLLQICKNCLSFNLIGPSGSGLPDVLFNHGVNSVGGIRIEDMGALQDALARQESWGSAGRKYQIQAQDYPGVSQLLEQIQKNRKH